LRKKLRPELIGAPWLIGPNPTDLGVLQGKVGPGGLYKHQEPVDHHVWQDGAGMWRCWSCVRHTAVGRVLYGWESASLEQAPWTQTGVMMRRDHGYGESLGDPPDPNLPRPSWCPKAISGISPRTRTSSRACGCNGCVGLRTNNPGTIPHEVIAATINHEHVSWGRIIIRPYSPLSSARFHSSLFSSQSAASSTSMWILGQTWPPVSLYLSVA